MEKITRGSKNIKIEGTTGTWYVIDRSAYKGEWVYLLEHEEEGEDVGHLIVNEEGTVIEDSVWNGFDDLEFD